MTHTHEVVNQVPAREDVDEFATNVPLVEAVARWGRADVPGAAPPAPPAPPLGEIGRHVGSAAFQRDAERANTHPPVLHTHDRWGNRIDEVEYDDAYHRIMAAAIGAGAHTSAWADPGPGANVDRAAAFFLFAQVEPGPRVPRVDVARGGADPRARGIRPSRRMDAAAAEPRVRPGAGRRRRPRRSWAWR